MRPNIKSNSDEVINEAVKFAHQKLGLSYNFYFEERQDRYICTQLVEESFKEAGFDLNLRKSGVVHRDRFKLFSRMHRVVKADDFLKGNFDVVFRSSSLEKKSHPLLNKKMSLGRI